MESPTATWSDGRIRSNKFHGTELDLAIEKYFADRNEEERLKYLWDNEAMNRERKRSVTETAKSAKA